ncbi:hypothetical protein AQPE_4165 [Aquipluma nitroreducens]|uniref:Uncharacterized protein n=1 Tax=Aquipluma nitroreducens TaxID=2010828 RepID=A0A5K7SFH0_9BACT|nr:hypothetical protein AQPE_4165 [Aquipluma nitroreducens]
MTSIFLNNVICLKYFHGNLVVVYFVSLLFAQKVTKGQKLI